MTIRRALDSAAAYQQQVTGAFTDHTIVNLATSFGGPGDILTSLSYPTYFTERPFVSVHAEVRPGSPLEAGAYPWVSAPVVTAHVTEFRDGMPLFLGAVVLVTVNAVDGTSGELRWRIEGTAPTGSIWNPAPASP